MDEQSTTENYTIRVAMLARVVYPFHGFGGIERHVFHLVTHLAQLGVAVHLYVQDLHTSDSIDATDIRPCSKLLDHIAGLHTLRYDFTSPALPPNGIIGRQLNYPWYTWRLGLKVAHAVRSGAYDIVHSQGLCATGYAAIRIRDPLLGTVPFVANPHGMEEFRTPDWRKWLAYAPFRALYRYGHRRADRVIATDVCTQADLPRYLHVAPAQVRVIPSAIDVDECRALVSDDVRVALRTRLRLAEADLILLSVGRLERNKGYHILIDALAHINADLPPRWRWLLVGVGKERDVLERQVYAAGIAAHVTFVGRLDDTALHSLYQEVDLVVHPTLYEGSSLVTLEGMIHCRPVIACAVGGIPDKVFDDRNGYLVRPGDISDLAAKLRLALTQRERWSAWGAESVNIVLRDFAWPIVARKTLALYDELLCSQPAQTIAEQ